MAIIDVHTHMLSHAFLDLLLDRGAPQYTLQKTGPGPGIVLEHGSPLLPMTPTMFDYAQRIKDMDAVGVDIAVLSLAAPSVYWGGPDVSARAAVLINDDMRAAQAIYPDRLRFMAALPWQYPDLAVRELDRACSIGAVGVMVMANIQGRPLTDPLLEPIWRAIDDRALPVLVHPTNPPGYREMDLTKYMLHAMIAFMYDTTLAITRMILDGFFDRFAKVKIIAAHGGGTLPFLSPRIGMFFERMAPTREKIVLPPQHYLEHIYYDSVLYDMAPLHACIDLAGPSHVLYGTDYPHRMGDMAGCLARLRELPADQRDAIAGGNAQRIFNL